MLYCREWGFYIRYVQSQAMVDNCETSKSYIQDAAEPGKSRKNMEASKPDIDIYIKSAHFMCFSGRATH